MTEKRQRDLALKAYLRDTVPYTKQQILQMISDRECKVVWRRGVIDFQPKDDAAAEKLIDLINRGNTKPFQRVKRTDFAIRPMPHDIPHLSI